MGFKRADEISVARRQEVFDVLCEERIRCKTLRRCLRMPTGRLKREGMPRPRLI
jgi:hypothetical protein